MSKIDHLLFIQLNSRIIVAILEKSDQELNYINSEDFKQNFTSLDEYESFLRGQIDSLDLNISSLSVENKDLLIRLDSDLSYDDFMKLLVDSSKKRSLRGLDFLFKPVVYGDGSLYFRSLSYVLSHSTLFKELLSSIIRSSVYLESFNSHNDFFVGIYKNRDVNESVESKIIRYRLILDYFNN